MTDEELMRQFEDASLPPDTFHHLEHVRAAFLYLRNYPVLEAIARFSAALKRFAAAQGKAERYHETITWAYLLMVRERMARSGGSQSWVEFAAANADLLRYQDGVLKKYYRDETLASEVARGVFVFPDRCVGQ
jgi:hypothetical protein